MTNDSEFQLAKFKQVMEDTEEDTQSDGVGDTKDFDKEQKISCCRSLSTFISRKCTQSDVFKNDYRCMTSTGESDSSSSISLATYESLNHDIDAQNELKRKNITSRRSSMFADSKISASKKFKPKVRSKSVGLFSHWNVGRKVSDITLYQCF